MKTPTTININDYVSNDEQANELITDFTSNKYVIKGSTGIGGTTAVLDIIDQTIIIISPLVGMIQSKELKRKDHQHFIYGGSENTWFKTLSIKDNKIINCTPESFLIALESYPQLKNIPLFVDEFDYYANASYREKVQPFYNHLFFNHKAKFTLSTATPIEDYLDIPDNIELDIYIINRIGDVKDDIVIDNVNNYYNWVKDKLETGEKVILFTNDKTKIVKLMESYPNYQLLVGENLSTKVSEGLHIPTTQFDGLKEGIINYNKQLFILSTRYLIGMDFTADAHIGIIMDENSKVDNKIIADIVQSRGRCRNKILSTNIFIRRSKLQTNVNFQAEYKRLLKEFNSYGIENLEERTEVINRITLLKSYYDTKNSLKNYGFNSKLSKWEKNKKIKASFNLEHKFNELKTQDFTVTLEQFTNVILENIGGDDGEYHGVAPNRLLLWSSALLSHNNEYLTNYSTDKYDRLLVASKAVIDLNDEEYPQHMKPLDYKVTTKSHILAIRAAKEGGGLNESIMFSPVYEKIKVIINTLYKNYLVEKEYNTYSKKKTTEQKEKFLANKNNTLEKDTIDILHGFSTASKLILDKVTEIVKKKNGVDFLKYVNDTDVEKDKNIIKANDVKITLYDISKTDFKHSKRSLENIMNNNNYSNGVKIQVLNKYDSLLKIVTTYKTRLTQYTQLYDKFKRIKQDIYTLTINEKQQVKQHNIMNLYLMCNILDIHTAGFRVTKTDGRIYNPLTKTTRQLRKEVAYVTKCYDIKSAYANITNKMIRSNNNNPYERLMEKKGITRSEAKVEFNVALNSTYISNRSKLKFVSLMMDCGYTANEGNKLYDLSSTGKGDYFKLMSFEEEKLIKGFITLNGLKSTTLRLHDSILTTEDIEDINFNVDGIEFDVEEYGTSIRTKGFKELMKKKVEEFKNK